MPITEEESNKIKEHLLTQLENFPEDRRTQIKEQISSMSLEQVETFIEQNKLTHLGGQCIFCSIVANKTPSFKIAEDKNNIAILELNPLSKGHTLIVPKEHLDKTTESTKNLAQEIAKKLQERLNPNEIKINEIEVMNHTLLEIIPIYGNETQKRQATEEELKALQEEILKPKEIEIQEVFEPEKEKIPILSPRIP